MQYLYLIKCQQFYKIGVANDVESRLAQLSTGNPFELEVLAVYGFTNAELVERAIHQRYTEARKRGEWFWLDDHDLIDFEQICQLLGGIASSTDELPTVQGDEIDEAEVLAEPSEGAKWDFAAMFADGWRMETSGSMSAGTKGKVWIWRRCRDGERKALYGGLIRELPYPISDMRLIHQYGEEPLNPQNKPLAESVGNE